MQIQYWGGQEPSAWCQGPRNGEETYLETLISWLD